MRELLFLLVLALSAPRSIAQIDVNKMIQQRMAKGQGGQEGSGDVKIEDDDTPFVPNAFIGSFRMEMHHFQNGIEEKDSPTNMLYWSKEDMTLTKMIMPDADGQDMRILVDLQNKWQYMLMTDGSGGKTAMKSRKKKVTIDSTHDHAAAEVNMTNETKVIAGHTCVKVISKSEEGTWTGWVAQDLPTPFEDMMRNVSNGDPRMSGRMPSEKGFPLEFEWVDADGKTSMHCYMKDVQVGKVDESLFNLDEYDQVEMPGYGR